MNRIVIIGAGGHAREVLQILLTARQAGRDVEPVGFISEDAEAPAELCGLPVFGGFEVFPHVGTDLRVVVAVGTPSVARDLVQRAAGLGMSFSQAVSPLAWIAGTASIGKGSIVFPNAVVNTGAWIGDHVSLNVAVTVSHDALVGAFSGVGPGAHIAGNVSVGEGCYIGMGANIIQGVTVGEGSVVGAGAAVVEDVPAGVTVLGVPARVIGPATPYPLGRPKVAIREP